MNHNYFLSLAFDCWGSSLAILRRTRVTLVALIDPIFIACFLVKQLILIGALLSSLVLLQLLLITQCIQYVSCRLTLCVLGVRWGGSRISVRNLQLPLLTLIAFHSRSWQWLALGVLSLHSRERIQSLLLRQELFSVLVGQQRIGLVGERPRTSILIIEIARCYWLAIRHARPAPIGVTLN